MADSRGRDPAGEIAALAPGTVFHGVYEVVRCIKAGGMGAVYEVLQQSTQRYRALKVMLPSLVTDPEMRARFELEAKIAAGIESEHIVETMDAGIDDATGMPFIVMELLKGEDFGTLLKERKRLSPQEVVTFMHQAGLALERTHAAGIIHRDLKPENLFLTRRDDGSPRVKILDFGVAKIVADGSVNANSTKTVGSPLYMGPEQISGELKIGPAVDRYSLGHIAFTLLVGRPYWAVERKAADGIYPFLMQLMKGAKVPASERAAMFGVELPKTFDAWFAKATQVDPGQRYDSSVAQVVGLAEVFGIVAPAAPPQPPARTPLPSLTTAAPLPVVAAVTTAVTVVKEEAAPKQPETAAELPGASGPTPPPGRVSSPIVPSDESSLMPVTMTKPSRAWVVPASLLVVGFVGIVAAIVFWPNTNETGAAGSSELQQSSVAQSSSAASPGPTSPVTQEAPVVPAVLASAAPPGTSATPTVSSAKPVATSAPTATSTARTAPTTSSTTTRTKKTNVLDEY